MKEDIEQESAAEEDPDNKYKNEHGDGSGDEGKIPGEGVGGEVAAAHAPIRRPQRERHQVASPSRSVSKKRPVRKQALKSPR
jgi:hypothetical protein